MKNIEQQLIEDLANLFYGKQDMSEMDAADFVDNANEIWNLRQRAIEIKKSYLIDNLEG